MSDMHMPPPTPPTPPSVPPGYQPYQPAVSYSSWGTRVGSYLLRALPGMVLFVPIWAAMIAAAASTGTNSDSSLGDQSGGPGALTMLILIVAYVLILTIQIRSTIQRGRLGYDFADAATNQRLISDTTHQPLGSGWSVFGRSLLHIVDALPCYIGFLAPCGRQRSRRSPTRS